ncbi:MAG TPA: hypothetical protein VGR53_03180 [Nitrososphaerales archaeon]|nr:hypothetical protein [Nitrososphaerales archaeon]
MPITLDEIDLSVIGALVGLLLTLPVTYLVVDRIVERNERNRLKPIEITAKERLKSKLGVGSLTTFLITLAIDVRTSMEEKKAMSREVAQLYASRLKSFQSDLEMLLGVYNNVLTVEIEHTTASIISQIEHLEEDVQYVMEIHPRHATETQVDHIEHVIMVAVRFIKKELDALGAESRQVGALEEWLTLESEKHSHPEHQEPIEVSGKHTLT